MAQTENMSRSDYDSVDATNWSLLKHLAGSEAHYLYASTTAFDGDTADMRIGRAVHAAILEPEVFAQMWSVWGSTRRGKDWDAFAEANEGREILNGIEAQRVREIVEAIWADERTKELLDGFTEHTLTWTDEETGIDCKARLDVLLPDGCITDLKTTRSTDERTFTRISVSKCYHGQAAFYGMGAMANGYPLAPFRMVAVENNPPNDVAVFVMPEMAVDAGERLVRDYLRRLKRARDTNEWPGRNAAGEVELLYPDWVLEQGEDMGGW